MTRPVNAASGGDGGTRHGGLRRLVTAWLRVAFRLYFRAIHVEGAERFPRQGPVLLVANHPNSLVDPALLATCLPRPIHFGAKHTLFTGPLRLILDAFGAIPLVRAQDDRHGGARNAAAFKRFAGFLHAGEVTAIFPEGLTQDDAHLAPVKGGAARIALATEAEAAFSLGVTIVPVGLQYEPRRQFRGDAFVRVGEPFTISDLSDRYTLDPRETARRLSERIAANISRLAYHVDAAERAPFVERLVDVYFQRARRTGIAGIRGSGVRGELKQRMAACLNHYSATDPQAVADVERALRRYEHLRDKAGIHRSLLEERCLLLPGPLAPIQAAVEALLGAVPALFGFVTGAVPYYFTKWLARHVTKREHNPAALSLSHVLIGAAAFPLVYTLEIWWVHREFSAIVTLMFALLLVPAGLLARAWTHRMRKLAVNVGGRLWAWMIPQAVARVTEARNDLVQRMERLRSRYRTEVLGWAPETDERSHPSLTI